MINNYLGSSDVKNLLAAKSTKMHQDLFRKFLSDTKVHYNAFSSPIDALRTGAILEEIYIKTLGNDFYPQVKVYSKEMDVFLSTLDFAKIWGGEVVDFEELKTIWFTDFIEIVQPLKSLTIEEQQIKIKKEFSAYYNQIQQQLFVTNLESCNLVFLSVETYDDDANYLRELKDNDVIKFRIFRNEAVIEKIKNAGQIFQTIKDYFKNE